MTMCERSPAHRAVHTYRTQVLAVLKELCIWVWAKHDGGERCVLLLMMVLMAG